MKMIFLILLSSLVSFSSAEKIHFGQLKLNIGSDNLNERGALLSDCDDLVFPDVWDNMGFSERADDDQKYEINPETEDAVVAILGTNNVLTLGQQLYSARLKHPELTRDIDNYVAVLTRPIVVYVLSAIDELEDKKRCIINDECKVTLSKKEAVGFIEYLEGELVDFALRLGEFTNESFKNMLQRFERNLKLKCNFECVVGKYEQWMTACAKPNGPFTTTTTAYPPTERN